MTNLIPPSHSATNDFIESLEQRVSENKLSDLSHHSSFYRVIAEKLGIAPWRLIIPLSFVIGFGIVAILGDRAIRGVSLLQWGF